MMLISAPSVSFCHQLQYLSGSAVLIEGKHSTGTADDFKCTSQFSQGRRIWSLVDDVIHDKALHFEECLPDASPVLTLAGVTANQRSLTRRG